MMWQPQIMLLFAMYHAYRLPTFISYTPHYYHHHIQIYFIIIRDPMSWSWGNDFRSRNILPKRQVQQFLHKWAFTDFRPEPISKYGEEKWTPRFKFIGLQDYCPHCKRWGTGQGGFGYCDYCSQCGYDFFSHMDLHSKELAPIRRGKCSCCQLITSADLNGAGYCQQCFKKADLCKGCRKYASSLTQCLKCNEFEIVSCREYCMAANQKEHQKTCKQNTKPSTQTIQSKSQPTKMCNSCKKEKPELLVCGKCHKVRYCDVNCQKSDWPNHKVVCSK